MEIYVNGEGRKVPDDCTAAQLVSVLGLEGQRIAMEVNTEIVPRSAYPAHPLQAGDRVEIVNAIGGG
ncbi:MAG: sulfur carrier protein ThiS [Pseudomonadota bacterium]|nr:MAG: sulfur carrier protein ThiS [Pseudomonadota bacterium]